MKKNKSIYKDHFYLLLFALICISSCKNDDDSPTIPRENIIGEWFMDLGDANKVNFNDVVLASDGTFTDWEVNIGYGTNLDILAKGTYIYDGMIKIRDTTEYDRHQYYQVWKINSVTKYTLDVTDISIFRREVMHRIVDTYRMNIGDNKQWIVNDAGFNALSYVSCDDKIATVDASGMITAKKRGTSFIRAISESEEAVIKVVVVDDNVVIDDYTRFVGKKLDNLVDYLGSPVEESKLENGQQTSYFHLFDEYARDVNVAYVAPNHINQMLVGIRYRADMNSVVALFNEKYTPIEPDDSGNPQYLVKQDDGYVLVEVDEIHRQIAYYWLPSSLNEFDGVVVANVDDLAAYFGFDLSQAINGDLVVPLQNTVYSYGILRFNETTREILLFDLICRPRYNETQIRRWFDARYKRYTMSNGSESYISGNTFVRSDYYVSVSTNPDTGNVSVNYIRNSKK